MKSIRVRRECTCGMKFELEVEREPGEFAGDVQRDVLRIADEWQAGHVHWGYVPRSAIKKALGGAE